MATIYNPGPGLGETIGGSLSSLLNALAEQKAQQIRQQELVPGLQKIIPGLKNEQAESIALMDPRIVKEYIKQVLPNLEAAPVEQGIEDILTQMGGSSSGELLAPPVASQAGAQGVQQAPKMTGQKQIQQETQRPSTELQELQKIPFYEKSPGSQRKELIDRMRNYLKENKNLTPKQRGQLRKQLNEQLKEFKEDQKLLSAEYKPVLKEYLNKGKVAEEDINRLEKLARLTREGDEGSAWVNVPVKTLKLGNYGIDLTQLMTDDAQEIDKLSKDMVRGIKDVFGARVTDRDLQTFMDTIPTLMQSKQGRLRVAYNLLQAKRADVARKNAAKRILNANRGKLPDNFDLLVEEIAAPEVQQYAENFRRGAPAEFLQTRAMREEEARGFGPRRPSLSSALGTLGGMTDAIFGGKPF